MTVPAMSCQYCGAPDIGPDGNIPEWTKFNIPFDKLEHGEDRCNLCSLLAASVLAYNRRLFPQKVVPSVLSILCIPGHSLRIEEDNPQHHYFDANGEFNIDGGSWLEIYAEPGNLPVVPYVGVGRNIPSSLNSEACIEIAREWISNCESSHLDCQIPSTTPLPKRVLDVGNLKKEPFLLETNSMSGRYATLSHCWGGYIPLITTLSTLAERKKEVKYGDLPKTFQDAITISRQLRIQYLWIDALCIIQDSVEDWEVESSRMADIYRNSYFTIAAASAKDSKEGCFVAQRLNREAVTVEVSDIAGRTGNVCIRRHRWEVHRGNHLFKEPLSTRAWVFQEQLLSTRTLHYTAYELLWECKTEMKCHCQPARAEHEQKLVDSDHYSANVFKPLASAAIDKRQIYHTWRKYVVQFFTLRTLSREDDILPALSGVASMFYDITNDVYLAGLWRGDLPEALLWSRTFDWEIGRRVILGQDRCRITPSNTNYLKGSSEYRGPSWSWVAVEGAVDYEYKWRSELSSKLESPAIVVDARCIVPGQNPFGKVASGSLVIKVPVLSCEILLSSGEEVPWQSWFKVQTCAALMSGRPNNRPFDVNLDLIGLVSLDVSIDRPNPRQESYWALRLGVQNPPLQFQQNDFCGLSYEADDQKHKEVLETWAVHYYILLERLPDQESYKRIGLACKLVPPEMTWEAGEENTIIAL